MTLPDRVLTDGFGPVESDNPRYWQELNEMGRRGELPERIWQKRERDE